MPRSVLVAPGRYSAFFRSFVDLPRSQSNCPVEASRWQLTHSSERAAKAPVKSTPTTTNPAFNKKQTPTNDLSGITQTPNSDGSRGTTFIKGRSSPRSKQKQQKAATENQQDASNKFRDTSVHEQRSSPDQEDACCVRGPRDEANPKEIHETEMPEKSHCHNWVSGQRPCLTRLTA